MLAIIAILSFTSHTSDTKSNPELIRALQKLKAHITEDLISFSGFTQSDEEWLLHMKELESSHPDEYNRSVEEQRAYQGMTLSEFREYMKIKEEMREKKKAEIPRYDRIMEDLRALKREPSWTPVEIREFYKDLAGWLNDNRNKVHPEHPWIQKNCNPKMNDDMAWNEELRKVKLLEEATYDEFLIIQEEENPRLRNLTYPYQVGLWERDGRWFGELKINEIVYKGEEKGYETFEEAHEKIMEENATLIEEVEEQVNEKSQSKLPQLFETFEKRKALKEKGEDKVKGKEQKSECDNMVISIISFALIAASYM